MKNLKNIKTFESFSQDEPQSVCVVIRKGNKYLGVTRKTDSTKWGLPGGKVDPGETPLDAVIRETNEETGLTLVNPEFVDERVYGGYRVFLYTSDYTGDIETSESGLVEWIDKVLLFSGPFGDYNEEVFKEYGL
jgi:8-oxo-dGTP pyrophosphatase MutT (NUDIX family)